MLDIVFNLQGQIYMNATAFTKETDVNGIEWERFNAMAQADEIGNIWPSVDYLPSKIEQE